MTITIDKYNEIEPLSIEKDSVPIYNTFKLQKNKSIFQKYPLPILFIFVSLFFYSLLHTNLNFVGSRDAEFDSMAVTVVDFGDYVSLRKKKFGYVKLIEIDEVFGNQYIKKKEIKVDATASNVTTDPIAEKIAGAVNPMVGNATAPLDLNPEIQPDYTQSAREAGIEGRVTLELIIDEYGKVLRARPVGKKKLGHGLEQSAARAYLKKRYKPSVNSDGKRITVKIYTAVRFALY